MFFKISSEFPSIKNKSSTFLKPILSYQEYGILFFPLWRDAFILVCKGQAFFPLCCNCLAEYYCVQISEQMKYVGSIHIYARVCISNVIYFKLNPDLFFVAKNIDEVVGFTFSYIKPWADGNQLMAEDN